FDFESDLLISQIFSFILSLNGFNDIIIFLLIYQEQPVKVNTPYYRERLRKPAPPGKDYGVPTAHDDLSLTPSRVT
ncbi:hypothetical protein NX040_27305, partial [Escherichia coli]|nr:hypothetical protein [Escherichia coli]